MTTPDVPSTSSDRRIYRALDYVSDKWMPCDQQVLGQINDLLRAGNSDTNAILKLVQSDVSLHLFSLQRFYRLLSDEHIQIDEDLSPQEFILEGGTDLLRLIFDQQSLLQTSHSLETADDVQKLRVFESLVSASSAQVLAPTFGLSSSDGFSGALIRQLGISLIAWNYPTVYAQALRLQKEGQNFIDVIQEKLGFSPELLTLELLHKWGMSRKVAQTTFALKLENSDLSNGLDVLSQLYHAGEALARANLPEVYPDARREWGIACPEILKRLGGAGFDAIQAGLEDHLSHYRRNLPALFSPRLVLDPRARIAEVEKSGGLEKNPYVPLCSFQIQDVFQKIYAAVEPGGNQHQILKELIHQLIPQAGFLAGCVYTVDPDRMRLVPQTAIGSARRTDFRPKDLSLMKDINDIVSLAYHSPQPMVEYHRGEDGTLQNGIAGSIGSISRLGVLYLLIDGDQYDADSNLVLNQFKAIQRAISDCLNSAKTG